MSATEYARSETLRMTPAEKKATLMAVMAAIEHGSELVQVPGNEDLRAHVAHLRSVLEILTR